MEIVVWGFEIASFRDSRWAKSFSDLEGLVWSLEVDHLDIKSLQVNNGKYSRFRN